MRELSVNAVEEVNGGFKLNTGQAVAALAIGFVTGGPAGVGIAACGIVAAQGVNNLDELVHGDQ